jgi:hypothetical protein
VSSGLIYAVIVVLWAVVLVPMWLRRHDEATETRSMDRFQGAMHILSRRPASAERPSRADVAGDRREVLIPRRPKTRTVPDGAQAALASPASVAARRRMRVSMVLAALVPFVLILGLVHLVPVWAAAIPLALLVAYLLQVRHTVRAAQAREFVDRRARASAQRAARMAGAVERQSSGVAAGRAGLAVPVPSAVEEFFDAEAPVSAPRVPAQVAAAVAVETAVAAVAVEPGVVEVAVEVGAVEAEDGFYDAVAERVWEPVPVPLPTYVSAPKAPRSVRVIDLTKPGAWTSGRLDPDGVEDTIEVQASIDADAERDPIVTGELLIERRQAVGD